MSTDFCLNGVNAVTRFGKRNAQISGFTTHLAVRTPDDSAYDVLKVATPVADEDAATFKYVNDLVALNVSWKEAALVCSTVDVTIAAPGANIDSIAMAAGDRILLKAQGTANQNGVWEYDTAATPLIRPADWFTGANVSGAVISIREGTCAEEMYIASADPAIVDTDDPLELLIGTTSAGVTSVNDAVAVPAGGTSFLAVAGTGAVTVNVLDDSARISVGLAASVITLDIVANSITANELADDSVGNAQLAPNTAVSYVTGSIVFGDAGSTVAITGGQAPVPASSIIVGVNVDVGTAFDQTDVNVDVQVGAVSVMGNDKSDLNVAGLNLCSDQAAEDGAVTAVVSVSAGLSAGAADITVCYLRTA